MKIDYTKRQTNLSTWEMEWYFIFCVAVQGKPARRVAEKVEAMEQDFNDAVLNEPLLCLYYNQDYLRKHKMGKYNAWEQTLTWFNNQWRCFYKAPYQILMTQSVNELELIPGVGPKTARFFAVHCRGEDHAIIDTHIMRWIVEQGYPKFNKYHDWEHVFKAEAMKRGMKQSELDLLLWREASGN